MHKIAEKDNFSGENKEDYSSLNWTAELEMSGVVVLVLHSGLSTIIRSVVQFSTLASSGGCESHFKGIEKSAMWMWLVVLRVEKTLFWIKYWLNTASPHFCEAQRQDILKTCRDFDV